MDVIFPAANSNTVKLFYSKRNSSSMELRRSALGRQTLWNGSSSSTHPPPCNDKFEVGAFYEIDHGKLPPKSPIQLKALRIVKVKERRKMDLTVSFPSTYSLRNYFSAKSAGDRTPELDEKFVMSYNYAERILRRKIPASQLETERHQQRFWLVDPSVLPGELEAEDEEKPPASGCLMILKSSGLLEWGIRRRVKYIGRHRSTPPPVPVKKDGEEEEDEGDEEEEEEEEMAMGDQQQQQEEKEEESSGGRKRTRDACKKDIQKNKGKKVGRKKKKKKKDVSKKKPRLDIVKVNNVEDSRRERWSTERYESAEMKLLDIMRVKGAVIGNPILRQELRVEARKHIGDTGLLDHLLKHMAGKVIAQGSERFRRRHNAEGAMEYWLEPAELMEIRKEAGVADPCWVPPPGWKLGDATSLCVCGAECKKETIRLSEELEMIKRDMDQLRSLKQQLEKEGRDAKAAAKADTGILQEKYEKLLKMNAKLEAEMAGFVNCMEALKEEVKILKEEKEKRDKAMEVAMEEAAMDADVGDKKMITAEPNASTNNSSTTNGKGVSNEQILMVPAGKKVAGGGGGRRSGFRICKPQGTFLWPNMGSRDGGAQAQGVQLQVVPTTNNNSSSNNNNNNNSQKVSCTFVENHHHYHHQQQLMLFGGGAAAAAGCSTLSGGIPTPPSASSTATSAPKLLLLPSPTTPTSPSLTMVPPPPPPHNNTYSDMPRASTSSMEYCGGGGKKSSAEKTAVANWNKQEAGSSTIATDLVLATPSLYP